MNRLAALKESSKEARLVSMSVSFEVVMSGIVTYVLPKLESVTVASSALANGAN
jgi:hypothetical protein